LKDPQTGATSDAGDEPGGCERHATGTGDPEPGWLTDDAPLESTVDRQVLVAGENVPGLALALALQRAGYEPVLAGPREPSAASRVTYLPSLSVRLLDAIGVGDAVLDCSRPVTAVSVRRIDGPNHGTSLRQSDPDTPAPVVVRTRDLRRVLRGYLSPDVAREGRSIGSISGGTGGLEVTFDDGVREWFDVVVAARRIGPPLRVEESETTADPIVDPELTQYETTIETGRDSGRIHDAWTADALLQSIPQPGERADLFRVTAVGELDRSRLRASEKRAQLPFDLAEAMEAVTDAPATAVRQAGTRNERSLSRWGSGRVLRCGPAALPVAPASGLRPVLGLEDAWVLAEELALGPQSVPGVADTYARRRRTRVLEIRRRAADAVSRPSCLPSEALSPPLSVTRDMRAVALGPLADRSSPPSWTDTLEGL